MPDADGWASAEWIWATGERERVKARIVDGELRELHVLDTGRPVTGTRLRALPWGSLELALQASVALKGTPRAGKVYERTGHAFAGTLAAAAVSLQPVPLKKPERGYGDEFYKGVAATYRRALIDNRRPVVAVAEQANVPRSTAGRWVKEARRRNLLGKTKPGKAGA
jgi:hypothetical protein